MRILPPRGILFLRSPSKINRRDDLKAAVERCGGAAGANARPRRRTLEAGVDLIPCLLGRAPQCQVKVLFTHKVHDLLTLNNKPPILIDKIHVPCSEDLIPRSCHASDACCG